MIHNVDSIFMNTSISGKAEFILILCPGQFGDARWWQNHPVQRKVPPPSRSSSSSRSSPRSPRPQFSLVSHQQLGPEGVQPSHFAAPSAEPPQQQLPPSPWTCRGPSCSLARQQVNVNVAEVWGCSNRWRRAEGGADCERSKRLVYRLLHLRGLLATDQLPAFDQNKTRPSFQLLRRQCCLAKTAFGQPQQHVW